VHDFSPRRATIYSANDRNVSRIVYVKMCMYNDFYDRLDHDL
jgi:hypothetical protein